MATRTGSSSRLARREQSERAGSVDRGQGMRRIGIALRSGLFHLAYYLHTVATLVIETPIYFFLPQRVCVAVTRGWARRSLWLLRVICRTRVEYLGLENLPESEFILAHKHQSELETLALLAVLGNPAFVIKRELLFVPIWGLWALKAMMIFVTRGAGSAALKQITDGGRRAMRQGRPIVIAPEGTRRLPGASPAYKYGIVHLYNELSIPVVPMALNSGLYWPWLGFLRYPGVVVLSFLPPIAPGRLENDFGSRLIAKIETECDRLLLDADRSPFRPPFGSEASARLQVLRASGSG